MGIRRDISNYAAQAGWPVEVADVIYRTYQYAERRGLHGGCHSLSSILYAALCELGFSPELCIGECAVSDGSAKPFDHSWVSLDGKVIDIAISLPLPHVKPFCGLVVGGIDVTTGQISVVQYGIVTGIGFGPETKVILGRSYLQYMNDFPFERRNGAWTAVGRVLDRQLDVSVMRSKYAAVQRKIVTDGGQQND